MPEIHSKPTSTSPVALPKQTLDSTAKPSSGQPRLTTDPPFKSPLHQSDQLQLKAPSAQHPSVGAVSLFEAPEKESNGWKVKSVHLNMGYVLDNNVIHAGPMHLSNPENGTDLTITDYQQTDRKNWEYLQVKKGQRFAPDEPQFNLGVNLGFENGFGVEIDAKHNKIIMDGYDQEVHFEGMLNGEAINETAPLNTFMQQHEQTLGNLQLSTLGTYTFDLPAPAQHKFSFITKAGPSLITANTRTQLKGPDGEFDGGTTGLHVSGFGGTIENGLRYQFGPKVGRLGLELSHSLSYLNYAKYPTVNGYSGSHTAVYSSFALKATVGLYGNKK